MEQIRLGLALGPYKLRRAIDDIEILHCTRKDLDEALAADHYDLVYYTGHGTFEDAEGYLCLEKSDGGTELLSATDFARKLALPQIGIAYHQVGIVYAEQHDWPKALENYQEALAWFEKTGQHQHVGVVYHYVGMVYQEQRDWPKALESYQQALAWKEKTGQHHHVGATYHQVGRVYEEQRDWPKAFENYQQPLAWYEKTGQHHQIGTTLCQLGLLHEGQGDHVAAARYYQEALECFSKQGYRDPQHVVVAMRLLKQRFSEAADQEDLAPVRQRFERMLADHAELRDLSERLDREREGEA